jgi:mono/diheme cytochrome c family protein
MTGKPSVGLIAVIACLVLFLVGCASSSAGNARAGAKIFASKCASCHQTNGVGGTIGPDLTQDLAEANYDVLKYELIHPIGRMANVRVFHLTPQQIHDLTAFAVSDLKPKT